ncbi:MULTISPECIES: PLDc N-terminal domain-containing protein [Nocardiopsis]|uniref:Cardiolipin synthase N-terminal domain-containing protein n=1 Tax=Nocardiopsis sinuspersici TaxID=501010 RepID=A0A1V3C3S6_9ACTN|nr:MULTISPECIES: PLDc N-terminal domain-containing protein [Nocardiopsis]OOC55343.1 hypothetical protein NOSIN_17230 [Nocardiopsis sinuspersici]
MAHFLLLLTVLSLCVWVYALFDVIGSAPGSVRLLPKPAWTVVVLLLPKLGALLWFALGRPHRDPAPSAPAGPPPAFPEYDHPRRARATTHEEDEEFLRRCRERAEEQRRRAREAQEQKRRERGEQDGDGAAEGSA